MYRETDMQFWVEQAGLEVRGCYQAGWLIFSLGGLPWR
jgi:hypothetical protein